MQTLGGNLARANTNFNTADSITGRRALQTGAAGNFRASRLRYLARLAYWTVRHRSIVSARWILAFEGVA